ncbi:MAG: ABC transporter permease subunit [Oscillospiraceae bacterium]|jgi:NitT/TauT family transport system permease protein|nr:ABC transporter permease subunit [Oscillospiraceae bacterium]
MMGFTTSRKKQKSKGTRRAGFLRGVFSAAVWLLVWQIAADAVHQEILLVSPGTVLCRLIQLACTAAFWQTIAGSMLRILLGFLLAMVCGTLLAALTSRSKLCYALFYPIVSIMKATPVASFILLALVWLSSTRISSFTAFLIVLPSFWQNVTNGIDATDKSLLEMAQVYRFGRLRTVAKIYLPSIVPYFSAACRTGFGMAWKAGVAAEVLANTHNSIGGNLYDAKVYFETADLFVWTASVVLLSMLLEKGISSLIEILLRRLHTRGYL